MKIRIMKNNPAFLERDELIRGFVVRLADLKLLTERLHEQGDGPCQHILVIAPRGMGKTTLVLRVAFEVQLDKDLAKKWYPIVFSEESYEIATAAELWLEALGHLARQTQDDRWLKAYRELKNERDEQRLYERALGRLRDFADEQKKKLLVIVENLNMILGEQLDENDAWTLRHTLQNEPRIMMLATATSRFNEIDNVDKAMYDLFFSFKLERLDKNECRTVWKALTGHELSGDRIRPVEILTGGSPRLLAILGSFASEISLRELMRNLAHLIDEHTSYFKSNLESLPPAERKVYVTLADIWSPATASEVAKEARIDINKASASLHRLMGKGAVAEISKEGRTIRYQVTERLYNIYHLMRKNVGQESRVRWLVEFMIGLYEQDDIIDPIRTIADEACSSDPDVRRDHYFVYGSLVNRLGHDERAKKILAATNPQFFQLEDAPEFIKELPKKLAENSREEEIQALLAKAFADMHARRLHEAESTLRRVFEIDAHSWFANCLLMMVAAMQGRYEDADKLLEALKIAAPSDMLREYVIAIGWSARGEFEKSRPMYERALALEPENLSLRIEYGVICAQLQDWVAAESAFRHALDGNSDIADGWLYLASVQGRLEKFADAECAARQALRLRSADQRAWRMLAAILIDQHRFTDECEDALRRSLSNDVRDNEIVSLLIYRWQAARITTVAAARAAASRYAHFDIGGHFFLSGLAWCVARNGWTSLWQKAESWARSAVQMEPSAGYFRITLAFILGMHGQWAEAFEDVKKALESTRHSESLIRGFFLLAAANGKISESLAVLSASPIARELEPLLVAFQMLDGQTPNAPYEILEVAKDVVKQVEAIRAKTATPAPPTTPKASAAKRKTKR